MVKTILKWVILVVLIAYAVIATAWAQSEARKKSCTGINISIASGSIADSVTNNGVLSELSKFPNKIVGMPAYAVDTKAIENYLEELPQFEKVNCVMTTSGRLDMNVQPMVPAARVFDGSKSFYINKDGKEMKSKASFFVDVPVISGHFSREFTPVKVMPVIRFVESDPLLSQLVGMVYARSEKDIYLVPRIHGHIINFGDTLNMPEKRDALLAFYRKVMPYKGWETYDTISVKFRGQVVATRRDKARLNHGGDYTDEPDMEEATLPEIGV